jgi:hypothetical protein
MAKRRVPFDRLLASRLRLAPLLLLVGCAGAVDDAEDEDEVTAELSVPRRVRVNGVIVDVESRRSTP